ncbi:DUF6191 domain-containing protein [Streptomyces parvus]|uniref:DUF6191 domain-containing protein n=1 Tax=Streptomyces parvus TaxID=66428 RepID=UPI003634F03A
MFNFFEELFAPGRKHTSDERKRLELSRVDLGTGDPHRGPIDLASGKVTVRAPGTDPAPDTDSGTAPGSDPDTSSRTGPGTDEADPDTEEPYAAG